MQSSCAILPRNIVAENRNSHSNSVHKESLLDNHCQQWGNDRGIDPILLTLNTREWDPIPPDSPHDQQLEALEPIAHYMGEKIERDSRQYVTKQFQSLREKYQGFSIEGINPITGSESDYPRFRPNKPHKYFDKQGKLKTAKYLSRKGSTVQDFYARVPLHIAQSIADRYGQSYDRPEGDYPGFWQWAREHSIPLILVEGEGDALAVLSRGYLAIGVPGHNMAFSRTGTLRPELQWVLSGGSPIVIALDRDEKPKTIAAVEWSRRKITTALERLGATVTIAHWEPSQGKGAGDLDPTVLDQVILTAEPLEPMGERIIKSLLQDPWEGKIDHTITGSENLQAFLKTIEGDCFIIAPTGAGKTEALKALTDDQSLSHIAAAPLRSLTYGLAHTLDLAVFNDSSRREIDDRVAVVINSLHKIRPLRAYNLYLDEFEQSLDSLYRGKLNRQNRSEKIRNFEGNTTEANRLILSSATALPKDLAKLEQIRGHRITRIRFIADHGFKKAPMMITQGDGSPGSQGTAFTLTIQALEHDIRAGRSGIVACDTARQALELGILAKDWGLNPDQILIYSRDTLEDERIQGFRNADHKGEYLAKLGIRFFAYSPIMLSGDSIKDPTGLKLFDVRYGLIEGKTIPPAAAVQFLNRYRSSTPINLCLPIKGHFTPLIRGKYKNLEQDAAKLGALLSRGGDFQVNAFALGNDQRLSLEFQNYGLAFQLWAKADGHSVELDQLPAYDLKRINARQQAREYKAKPILTAEPITADQARELQAKPEPTVAEMYALKAWKIREFYGLAWNDPLTVELITGENFGQGIRQFNRLLQIAIDGYAEALDRAALENLGSNPQVQDLPIAGFRLSLWEKLGILEIIEYCLKNEYSKNDPTLRAWWDRLWSYDLNQYPKLLGFTLKAPSAGEEFYDPMVKAIGTLLQSLGFKTKSRRSREDDLLRLYHVTPESRQNNAERLSRYLEREGGSLRSTPLIRILIPRVDHPPEISQKLGEGNLNPPPDPHPHARGGPDPDNSYQKIAA